MGSRRRFFETGMLTAAPAHAVSLAAAITLGADGAKAALADADLIHAAVAKAVATVARQVPLAVGALECRLALVAGLNAQARFAHEAEASQLVHLASLRELCLASHFELVQLLLLALELPLVAVEQRLPLLLVRFAHLRGSRLGPLAAAAAAAAALPLIAARAGNAPLAARGTGLDHRRGWCRLGQTLAGDRDDENRLAVNDLALELARGATAAAWAR
eukprot:scaffold121676_cov57-Phaeocystis_antarctica.AAC.2